MFAGASGDRLGADGGGLVVEIRLADEAQANASGGQPLVLASQLGFRVHGAHDDVVWLISLLGEIYASFLGGVRSLDHLLREGQVGPDQEVDVLMDLAVAHGLTDIVP